MTPIELKIYKIRRLGYYSRQEDVDSKDDISDLINNLKLWISGQNIVENCTYADVDASGSDKTLCLSVVKNATNDDLFVTMWAGLDTNEKNAVGAIKANADPENIDIEEKIFSQDSVPGYPIYFYIIPEFNVLAPIRFNGSKNGIVSFYKYINGFIQRFSKYVHYKIDDKGERQIDYYGDKNENALGFYPMFKYRNWQRKDIHGFLRERREKILKVVKKDMVMKSRDEKIIEKLFKVTDPDDRLTGVRFKYELDFTPTKEELEGYFEECDMSETLEYGFKIGPDTHWLGHAIQKHNFTPDIRRSKGVLYSGAGTLAFLQKVRGKIIEDLSADDEDDADEDGDLEE